MRNSSKLTFAVINFLKNKSTSSYKNYLLKRFQPAKVPQLVPVHGPLVFQGACARLFALFSKGTHPMHISDTVFHGYEKLGHTLNSKPWDLFIAI